MDASQISFIWGIVALICGAFMLSYGASLFRYVLAFAGFYAGFAIVMAFNLDNQVGQLLIAMIVGAIAAVVLFMAVRITVYAAGGLFGLVLGFMVASIFGISGGWISAVLGVVGAGAGGYLGRNSGDLMMVLAAAAAGAYVSVIGLNILFTSETTATAAGLVPRSPVTLAIVIVLLAVSILAQMQILELRRRLRR
jgi:hypothetical protein